MSSPKDDSNLPKVQNSAAFSVLYTLLLFWVVRGARTDAQTSYLGVLRTRKGFV